MKFVENRKTFFIISLIMVIVGIGTMIMNYTRGIGALNFDVEFTGGTAMQINLGQAFTETDVMEILRDATGQQSPQVQSILGTNEVSVKLQSITAEQKTAVMDGLKEKYGITDDDLLSSTDISGTISGEMQQTALTAVFVACIAMLIYITIRFKDFYAGTSAIIALMHDIMLVITAYAIFRIPVNSSFIAAILTILGYSINATIIIFDRIRENRGKIRRSDPVELINKSIVQTLARSVNTSLTTLFTIGCVYIFGVQSIRDFALPLIIGIIGGAYSSICLSGTVWYSFMTMKSRPKAAPKVTPKTPKAPKEAN